MTVADGDGTLCFEATTCEAFFHAISCSASADKCMSDLRLKGIKITEKLTLCR